MFRLQDWRAHAASRFQTLADLCQLANRTIGDIVDRFVVQPFAVSSLPSKADFDAQVNATLNQFFQSTTASFRTLVDTTRLFVQVDRPYMGWALYSTLLDDSDLNVEIRTNETNNKELLKVGAY